MRWGRHEFFTGQLAVAIVIKRLQCGRRIGDFFG